VTGQHARQRIELGEADVLGIDRCCHLGLPCKIVYGSNMNRDVAIAALAARADALRAQGAASAYLFGSTIRDEARPDSDLDIFIDIAPGRRFSLFDLLRIQHFLEDELGREVDLTTRDSLHPLLRAEIERDAVQVF
jgi:predicted nucleotidyltransferase